jgi:hypothetical protein
VQHAVALRWPGDPTTEIKHLFRGLALKSVADGVLAQRSDPFLERAVLALRLDPVNRANLTGRSQEHRIEHLRPGMRRVVPAFRHAGHRRSPVEDLVEIGFELMAAQRLPALLRAKKTAQVEVGNPGGGFLEAFSQFDLGAHLAGELDGDMKGLGFALDKHGQDKLGMQFLAVGAAAVGLAALAGPFYKGAREHLAQGAEAPNQSAAKIQFRVGGQDRPLPLIEVKSWLRFAGMMPTASKRRHRSDSDH